MHTRSARFGLGMVALMALCCGGHLLLLLGLPIVAALTGQILVIPLAALVALAGAGVLTWRRRRAGCGRLSPAHCSGVPADHPTRRHHGSASRAQLNRPGERQADAAAALAGARRSDRGEQPLPRT